jgi:hypothetical protein
MSQRPSSHGQGHSHGISSPASSTYSPSISRTTGSQTPNIPLTLPRWGGPPPPPLPHHPHSSSTWNNSRSRADSSAGSGSISLAKITGPPSDRTTSDFYRRDPIDDYTHSSGSGTFSKIREYELQQQLEQQRAGGYERDRGVSEDLSSIGVGSKKRRRDSEKPLEEMDDR